jgi:ribosomal protein L18
MIKRFHANQARLRRHQRMRNTLKGSQMRPRLSVFRSGHHIYAQVIDDTTGRTLASASSLETSLRDLKSSVSMQQRAADAVQSVVDKVGDVVELAAQILPGTGKGKGAKTEKAAPKNVQQKGGQAQKGQAKGGRPGTQLKTVLPSAQKAAPKTPVEALAPIADNRKVATAREVGKLVGQRAKEQGVTRVVFDRGGYAYHGRVASLAEGAREAGLDF